MKFLWQTEDIDPTDFQVGCIIKVLPDTPLEARTFLGLHPEATFTINIGTTGVIKSIATGFAFVQFNDIPNPSGFLRLYGWERRFPEKDGWRIKLEYLERIF